jgi:hypothetical protein
MPGPCGVAVAIPSGYRVASPLDRVWYAVTGTLDRVENYY